MVQKYNRLAKEKVDTVLALTEHVDTTFDTTAFALDFSIKYTLHTGDAFIISSTYLLGAKLVTLDKDFTSIDDIEVIFANSPNPQLFNPAIYDKIENHDVILNQVESILTSK